MNWRLWRRIPWIDTRALFVARIPAFGRLLDLGTSDGTTLSHFSELRPDIQLAAVDLQTPPSLPALTDFAIVNLECEHLPWPDDYFDGITCMHLIEHLKRRELLWSEAARVLKPGARIYVETPGPKSLTEKTITGRGAGSVTMNFYDDPTHISLVDLATMRSEAIECGLAPAECGSSRNWLFMLAFPMLFLFGIRTRKFYVARLHWLGWSQFLVGVKQSPHKVRADV